MQIAFWLCSPLLRLAGVARRAAGPLQPRGYAAAPRPRRTWALPEKRPAPAPRLEVAVLETGEGALVRLEGVAGVLEAGALEAPLARLAARDPARVIFDLSGLQFISSLVMGSLVAFRRAAVRAGSRVCLTPDLHPAVREALSRADLLSLFEAPGPCATGPGAPCGAAEFVAGLGI
jgi:anti-anti-sigma regulatory factor